MSKVIKMIRSIQWTPAHGEPPALEIPLYGTIDPKKISLITDPESDRYDPRPFDKKWVHELSGSMLEEGQINPAEIGPMLQEHVYTDDTTSGPIWALEPTDGRSRTAACDMAGLPLEYKINPTAYKLSARRLTERATIANTTRRNYSPTEREARARKHLNAYLADPSLKKADRKKDVAYAHIMRVMRIPDEEKAEFKLLMDSWGEMSAAVKQKIENNELSMTVMRDLASVETGAQDGVIAVAEMIEKETVAIQDAKGLGGKRVDGTAGTDAIRAAKSILKGEALPESAERNEARVKATEKVAKAIGVEAPKRTGRLTKEEVDAVTTALQSWRVGEGLGHEESGAAALIAAVLEYVRTGDLGGLSSRAFVAALKVR